MKKKLKKLAKIKVLHDKNTQCYNKNVNDARQIFKICLKISIIVMYMTIHKL